MYLNLFILFILIVKGDVTSLAGSYPDGIVDSRNEYSAIAYITGPGMFHDSFHCFIHIFIANYQYHHRTLYRTGVVDDASEYPFLASLSNPSYVIV